VKVLTAAENGGTDKTPAAGIKIQFGIKFWKPSYGNNTLQTKTLQSSEMSRNYPPTTEHYIQEGLNI
jgi:hypothetical protein